MMWLAGFILLLIKSGLVLVCLLLLAAYLAFVYLTGNRTAPRLEEAIEEIQLAHNDLIVAGGSGSLLGQVIAEQAGEEPGTDDRSAGGQGRGLERRGKCEASHEADDGDQKRLQASAAAAPGPPEWVWMITRLPAGRGEEPRA